MGNLDQYLSEIFKVNFYTSYKSTQIFLILTTLAFGFLKFFILLYSFTLYLPSPPFQRVCNIPHPNPYLPLLPVSICNTLSISPTPHLYPPSNSPETLCISQQVVRAPSTPLKITLHPHFQLILNWFGIINYPLKAILHVQIYKLWPPLTNEA